MNKAAAVLAAALLVAGCGPSEPGGKKKNPAPVPQPVAPVRPPVGPQPGPGPETHRGTTDDNLPVKPPPPLPSAPLGYDVGSRAPELALNTTAGKPFLLSSFRGEQPVLIVFGATW